MLDNALAIGARIEQDQAGMTTERDILEAFGPVGELARKWAPSLAGLEQEAMRRVRKSEQEEGRLLVTDPRGQDSGQDSQD